MTKIRITGALVALAFLATGCNGIGKGSKIESIRIAQDLTKTAEEETEVKAFTCLAAPLILVGTFSKGDVGDFAFRAHWTSDDESVARVANYGDPVEGKPGQLYVRGGVVLPQPTTVERSTIIRAEYLGLTASMKVVVKPSENLRIVPAVSRMIPKSAQKFTVRAKLEGVDRDVTAVSNLEFVEDGSEATATVGLEAGLQLVRAVAVGGPLTLKAAFDAPCPDAPTSEVRIEDAPLGGLKLDYQEGFGPQIAERTSESLQLKVDFGDLNSNGIEDEGEVQRLDTFDSQLNTLYGYDRDGDGQCELLKEDNGTTAEPNPPTALTFGSLLTQLNTMTAVADDDTDNRSTTICASFGATSDPDGDGPATVDNGTLSNVLPIEIVDAAIDTAPGAMTITASDPCVPASGCTPLDPAPDPTAPEIDEGTILLLKVQSSFGGGTYTQDISKSVAFTSSIPTLASVGLGGNLVTASDVSVINEGTCTTGSTSCTATITATWIGGGAPTNPTATIDVKVNARADE